MNKILLLVLGVFVIVIAVVFYQRQQGLSQQTTQTSSQQQTDTSDSMMEEEAMEEDSDAMEDESMMGDESEDAMMEDVTELTVEGDEFSFSPSSITFEEGENVRLTFVNVGNFPHNFVVDELDVASQTIPGGESDVVEFTANTSGTYSFYCSVGNHRQQGMEGDLEVQQIPISQPMSN